MRGAAGGLAVAYSSQCTVVASVLDRYWVAVVMDHVYHGCYLVVGMYIPPASCRGRSAHVGAILDGLGKTV